MMDIAKSETFKNFNILNKALLFLIKVYSLFDVDEGTNPETAGRTAIENI